MLWPRGAWRASHWAGWLVWALNFGLLPLPAATYYVATNGVDGNGGSSGAPWATVNYAANTMNPGDTVFIHGGTYRQTVYVWKPGTSNNPITFQAYPGEVPVVSGADIFTNWTWDTSATPNAWSIPWTTNLASTTDTNFQSTNLTAMRPEMVVFNGQVLWAVSNRNALVNASFFVNGPSTSPTAIYALFPSNAPPAGNTVEIADRPHDFYDTTSNTVINGLTFRYGCNICQDLMVQVTGQNNVFENNTVEWANAGGLYAAGSYNVFSNNLVHHNGQLGFSGTGSYQLCVNNQSVGNNWKLYNPAWEAGGGKWAWNYNSTIRGQQAVGNGGPGIWFDMTNCNNLIEQCFICSNSVAGIQLELHAVGFTVQNNVICDTQVFSTGSDALGSGLTLLDACSNNILNNTIYDCAGDGISLSADSRVTNSSGGNRIFNNIIAFNSQSGSYLFDCGYQIYISGQTPAEALSNTHNGNVYWSGSSSNTTFCTYINRTWPNTDSLTTWQAWTGGDANSVEQNPLLFNSSLPAGFYLTATSPARALGVTPPVTVTNDFLGNPRPATGADAGAVQFIPAAPTNFSATPGNAMVSLIWTASAGVNGYNVKRSTTNGGPYTTIKNVNTTNCTDTGLVIGTTYYYVVSATVTAGEESPNSSQQSATPQAPPPPGFSAQPAALRRFVGGNASFSATVTGGPPISLQWYLNSTSVAGATNSSLLRTNLTSAQAGNYSLVASNVSAVVTSLPAQLAIWTPAPYATAVLADAPAAYWRLDESNGPTVFDCLSTNNGAASAAVIFGVTGAIPNDPDTACHFDASNSDKVDVGYDPALNSPAFSFECWARVTGGSNTTASPLTSRNAPTTQGYYFQVSSNNVWQFCSGTDINNLWHTLSGPAVTPGRWTHLAGTYSGTGKTFYVNGLPVASATVQFAPNTNAPLRLGAGVTEGSGSDFFSGDVDEVAVYGYALSTAQVQTHYQAAFVPETLSIAPTNGGAQATWLGGTLQAADSLTGPWTVVTNAVPPWGFAPATNQQFFRIRIP